MLEDAKELFPQLKKLWLNAGYNGKEKGADCVRQVLGWNAEIVKQPRRWVGVPEGVEPPPYLKKGVRGIAEALGGGTELFVDRSEP